MKNVLFIIAVAFSLQAQADVFTDYQKAGTEALTLAKDAGAPSETFVAKIQEMVTLGYQIMDLYLVKYPGCMAQYEEMKAVDAQFLTMTYDQISDGYHDGKALSTAPKMCYMGRSMVVHPYQMAALSIAGQLQASMNVVDHELNEVIERADKIKLILGL